MPKNTILKDVDGRYFYRFTDESGMRRALRSRKGETRRAFAERCDAAERSEDSSTWTFAQLWDAWSLVRKNTVSAHTYNEQQRMYQRLLEKPFGSLLIQDITRQAVYRFLQRLGAEGASHAYLSKIKGCLSLPYKWGRMALQLKASDPTEGISLKGLSKKRETRVRVISADEEQRFFEAAAGSVWYNFFRLLLTTGMRPSEAMGLQLVDLAEEGIHITRGYTRNGLSTLKTKNAARVFPWTAQLREIVANQKEQLRDLGISSIWLFPTESGQPSLNAATLAAKHYARQTAVWKRGGRNGQKKIIRLEDPIQLSLYDFRHTFATRAARVLPARTLQYLMGHATIAVTLRYYIDIEAEDLEAAAEKLDAFGTTLVPIQKKTNSAKTS